MLRFGRHRRCPARGASPRNSVLCVNFQKEFKEQVVQPFIEDYVSGRTPIPCVQCNSGLKFSELVRVAERLGASHVATGHYVRLQQNGENGRFEIWKARDLQKDQSYFLFNLSQDQLSRATFPLADLTKAEVREIARATQAPGRGKAREPGIVLSARAKRRARLSNATFRTSPWAAPMTGCRRKRARRTRRHSELHDRTAPRTRNCDR